MGSAKMPPERSSCLTIVVVFILLFVLALVSFIGKALEQLDPPPLVPAFSLDSLSHEWQVRLAQDYPDWTVVVFWGVSAEYLIKLVSPDIEFVVMVIYKSDGDAPPETQDTVFCVTGEHNNRVPALLDFIHKHYICEGKEILGVLSTSRGEVTVTWGKTTRFGPFSSATAGRDTLRYDDDSAIWCRIERRGP